MNDERLQILRMVEEGKVSADEAAKLLDALEAPPRSAGPKARHVRFTVTEGGKTKNFSVGVGLASWALGVASTFTVNVGQTRLDKAMLEAAIERGATGKVFEAADDGRSIEIWLDA